MQIQVHIANQYGRDVIKPACQIADKFCDLLGQKTLTRHDIELIKSMGYEIRVTTPQPEFL
jgi:hypothetical protein